MREGGSFKLTERVGMKGQIGADRIEFGRLAANGRQGDVRIDLNHPSMGRLQVELNIDGEAVKAVFHTDTQAVKAVLEGSMQDLKASLSGKELELENFDVRSDGEGWEGSPGGREDPFDPLEESLGEIDDGGKYLYEADKGMGLSIFA